MSSAIDAGIKTHPNGVKDEDWRICPLYKMDNAEYREFKIEQILSVNPKKTEDKVYEIKAWIIEEDFDRKLNNNNVLKYKKGTIFIQKENGRIIMASTSTEKGGGFYRHILLREIKENGKIKEVDIMDIKQIHPHLLKELKEKLNIKK